MTGVDGGWYRGEQTSRIPVRRFRATVCCVAFRTLPRQTVAQSLGIELTRVGHVAILATVRNVNATQSLPLPPLQAARLRATLADRKLAYQGDEDSLERASAGKRTIPDPAGGTGYVVEAIRVSYRHQLLARLALRCLLAAAGDGEPEPEPDVDTDVDTNTTPRAGAPPGHARATKRHQLALSCRSSTSRGPAHHGPPDPHHHWEATFPLPTG